MEDSKAGTVSAARRNGGMNDSIISSRKNNPDKAISYLETDVFERLVPFWKLQCYFTQNGYSDFYPDLFEKMRNSEKEHPELKDLDIHENVVPFQLNFVRGASLVAGKIFIPILKRSAFSKF